MNFAGLNIGQMLLIQVGKAEKLKPMELELRRLEDLAESIVNDFAYMRAREEEMRDTNGEYLGISLSNIHVYWGWHFFRVVSFCFKWHDLRPAQL